MTSEVVLMNRLAVAMAADSAATIETGRGSKIFQSANKLFTLSKYHPVGVMIYNNAAMLDVPWETVIKVYRQALGNRSFHTLGEYANHFLSYLDNNERLFPKHHQDKAYLDAVEKLFQDIFDKGRSKVFQLMVENKPAGTVQEHVHSQVSETHAAWAKLDDLPCFTDEFKAQHRDAYSKQIIEKLTAIFQSVQLSQEDINKLIDLGVWVALKDEFSEGYSGIVVAGFGEHEIYPTMCSFVASLVVGNHVKKSPPHTLQIGDQYQAIIQPFAQSDMVNSFTDGIDPNFKRMIGRQTMRLALGLPATVIDAITDLTDEQKDNWKKKANDNIKAVLDEFFKNLQDHQFEKHTVPVYSAIRSLPKDELAAAAEALVNLNSFRQRVSMDAETVGGPIDVAVISKGDGFIWIKRKHYFDTKLNIHFARNYYLDLDVSDSEESDHEPEEAKKRPAARARKRASRHRRKSA